MYPIEFVNICWLLWKLLLWSLRHGSRLKPSDCNTNSQRINWYKSNHKSELGLTWSILLHNYMICGRKYFRCLKKTKNTFLWFEIFDLAEKKLIWSYFSIFAIFCNMVKRLKFKWSKLTFLSVMKTFTKYYNWSKFAFFKYSKFDHINKVAIPKCFGTNIFGMATLVKRSELFQYFRSVEQFLQTFWSLEQNTFDLRFWSLDFRSFNSQYFYPSFVETFFTSVFSFDLKDSYAGCKRSNLISHLVHYHKGHLDFGWLDFYLLLR
jgi:hypothetical protein